MIRLPGRVLLSGAYPVTLHLGGGLLFTPPTSSFALLTHWTAMEPTPPSGFASGADPMSHLPPDGEHDRSNHWTSTQTGRYFDEERAAQLRGTIKGAWLFPALLFSPTRFMLAHAVHVKFSHVFLIMWFAGAMGVFDQLEFRTMGGSSRSLPSMINTWPSIWTAAIVGGLVRGMIYYWLGGLWFRARLYMCGVRGVESDVAGRVFAFLLFPGMLASFCYYAAASLFFADFISYTESENTVWVLAAMVPVCVTMYSSFLAYASVRGVFNAKRVWAILWFLLLPLAIRLAVLAVVLLMVWFAHAQPAPDLNAPGNVSSQTITARYPGNWVATVQTPESGPTRLIDLSPTGHDASIALEIEYYNRDTDPMEATMDWVTEIGFDRVSEPVGFETWGRFSGIGNEYRAMNSGDAYRIRLFFSPLQRNAYFAVREIVHADSVDRIEPGVAFVRGAVSVRDPMELPPMLSSPVTLSSVAVSFEAPRDWWVTRYFGDPPSPESAVFTLRASSPQGSRFEVYGYQSEEGPRSELGMTLDYLGVVGRMQDEQSMDSWLGLEGIGVQGVFPDDAGRDRLIRVLVLIRPTGDYLEIRSIEYLDTQPLTSPAFEHIESSFRSRD